MFRGNKRKDIFIDEEDKREMKEFIHYSNMYEEKNFLEIKESGLKKCQKNRPLDNYENIKKVYINEKGYCNSQ